MKRRRARIVIVTPTSPETTAKRFRISKARRAKIQRYVDDALAAK